MTKWTSRRSGDGSMKHSQTYDRIIKAVDNTISSWNKADRITEIEQRAKVQSLIYGMSVVALYVLGETEYHDFVNYIHEQGFNH